MIHLSPNKINGSIRRKTQKNGYDAKQTHEDERKKRGLFLLLPVAFNFLAGLISLRMKFPGKGFNDRITQKKQQSFKN